MIVRMPHAWLIMFFPHHISFSTSPCCGLIMLTMFFLSCTPPLLLGCLLTWLPCRRRRLRFMSLMLLLSSEFLPRWPRSLSSGPPPDDILLRRQRTPVAQTTRGSVSLTRVVYKETCLLSLTHTLIVLSLPLTLLLPLPLFSLIVFLSLDFKAPLKSVLRPPHVH